MKQTLPLIGLLLFIFVSFISCASSTVRAEEYYALGVAYFDLERYDEAERWLNRAKFHRQTRNASEYYLGCIAYETGRYNQALQYFSRIINRDGENITALRAAAYTSIKLNEFNKAEEYYQRILDLVPEAHDAGYNYALVLAAMGRSEEAEQLLVQFNISDNAQALFLLARIQRDMEKPEAADAFSTSLLLEDNPLVRFEFAAFLADLGLAERALEEYHRTLENPGLQEQKREEIRAAIELLETNG